MLSHRQQVCEQPSPKSEILEYESYIDDVFLVVLKWKRTKPPHCFVPVVAGVVDVTTPAFAALDGGGGGRRGGGEGGGGRGGEGEGRGEGSLKQVL